LELAHYSSALGVEVHVVQRSVQVLRGINPDVAKVVELASSERGMGIYTRTRIPLMRIGNEGKKETFFDYEGGEIRIAADVVLNA